MSGAFKKSATNVIAVSLMLVIAMGGETLFAVPQALAEDERSAPPKPETRRVQTLTKRTYDKLQQAQEATANNQHGTALSLLSDLLSSDRINEYERAIVHQTIAYTYADKGDYSQAVRSFERALSQGTLSDQASLEIKYNLGQLYLSLEQVNSAIQWFEDWKQSVAQPSPQGYAMLAQAYAQADRFDTAIPYAERAVNNATEPRENWYQLLISLYLQKGQYQKAIPVVERATSLYPGKRTYWSQLVALYSETNNQRDAFATMRSMYRQNMFTRSSEYTQLAEMFLYFESPYQAGSLLSEGLESGTIDSTGKNWTLLADSWVMAREWKSAVAPLSRAASMSNNGKLYLRLGHVYVEDENWSKAENALVKAVNAGSLSSPGQAWLLLGIARAKQEKFESAKDAFTTAENYSAVRAQATDWLATINARMSSQADAGLQ
jgi:tetratricopeptide (TPR) repeat protein